MRKPDYQREDIRLYLGDAKNIVPQLSGLFDCIVADPPYGISHVSGGGTGGKWDYVKHQGVTIAGDDVPFDPTFLIQESNPWVWVVSFERLIHPFAGGRTRT